MANFPKLHEMGVQNPHEIARYSHYTTDDYDILRLVYNRKPGSLLPVSRKYKFPLVKKSVVTDSGSGRTQSIQESSHIFRDVLRELEQVEQMRDRTQDVARTIRDEIQLLEEDIASRLKYIKYLSEKL
ncbi:DUF3461 family protein [Roseovarius sp. 2305UL8-3]|uniref:DUF3461 family protein n=1 Tax=Roseovarius conchicola TaxID=3121636 RepID=UPI00352872C3